MSDALKDMQTFYPFLPNPAMYGAVSSAVRDMRIVVTLPVGDMMGTTNRHNIRAFVKAIDALGATAEVVVHCNQYSESVISMTVPIVRLFSGVPATGSWILWKPESLYRMTETDAGWDSSTKTSNYEIHPDCLFFMQESPTLRFVYNTSVKVPPGATTTTYPMSGANVINLVGGYNTTATWNGSGVTFYAAENAGDGRLSISTESTTTVAPYVVTADVLKEYQGYGIRSINGLTDNVVIRAQGTTSVQMSGNTLSLIQVNTQDSDEQEQP